MVTTESHLEVAVDEKVSLKIVVIFSKRVDELFCYLSGQEGDKQRPENPCPLHSWSPSLVVLGRGARTLSQPA